MRSDKRSRTADYMALSRAIESMRPSDERACLDPLARALLPAKYRLLISNPFSRKALLRRMDRSFPGHHGYVVARTAYMDEKVTQAIGEGIEQLVILGAGHDSRAYRIPGIQNLAVYEVDHPATQEAKRAALNRALDVLPAWVRYVPVDFGRDRLDDGLLSRGYQESAPTLFLWEGTTPYLSREAVEDTLAFVAANTGAGTQIAFDYILQSVVDGSCSLPHARSEAEKMSRTDEPFTFGIDADRAQEFLYEQGFDRVEQTTAEDLAERFFPSSSVAPAIKDWWRLIRAFVREDRRPNSRGSDDRTPGASPAQRGAQTGAPDGCHPTVSVLMAR